MDNSGQEMQHSLEKELNSYEILTPGGALRPFQDTESILRFAKTQYPDWKPPGNVISVPEARIPKIFLTGDQMTKALESYFKASIIGEKGELLVYRRLMELKSDQCGLLVFPNVNGTELFCHQPHELHVEIDTILVHPEKGVFIFNVKNAQGRNGLNEKSIKQDMQKHYRFVHCLSTLFSKPTHDLPIHGVICNVKNDSKAKWLSQAEKNNFWFSNCPRNKVLVFEKSDLTEQNFHRTFWEKLDKLPSTSNFSEQLDIFVARLVALTSMEDARQLIHEKLVSGELQSMNKTEKQAEKLKEAMFKEDLSEEAKQAYENSLEKSSGNKVKVILWTKEQISVIVKVLNFFCSTNRRAFTELLQLNVVGPKGSGKTMLLMYIKKILEKSSEMKIKVCDGSMGYSSFHFKFLQLESDDLILPKSATDLYNFSCIDLLLMDEVRTMKFMFFLRTHHLNFVLFSSELSAQVPVEAETCCLTASLRSTVELTYFCDLFRLKFLSKIFYQCKPKHNLCGTKPEIIIINEPKSFCPISLEKIVKSSSNIGKIMVATFICHKDLREIEKGLNDRGILYSNIINHSAANGDINPWKILFTDGRNIDGCEFRTVIILLSPRCHRLFEIAELFIAMTRATVRLIFVVESFDVNKNEDIALQNLPKFSESSPVRSPYHESMMKLESNIRDFLKDHVGNGDFLFLSEFQLNLPKLFNRDAISFSGGMKLPVSEYPPGTFSYYLSSSDYNEEMIAYFIQSAGTITNLVYTCNKTELPFSFKGFRNLLKASNSSTITEYYIYANFSSHFNNVLKFFQDYVAQIDQQNDSSLNALMVDSCGSGSLLESGMEYLLNRDNDHLNLLKYTMIDLLEEIPDSRLKQAYLSFIATTASCYYSDDRSQLYRSSWPFFDLLFPMILLIVESIKIEQLKPLPSDFPIIFFIMMDNMFLSSFLQLEFSTEDSIELYLHALTTWYKFISHSIKKKIKLDGQHFDTFLRQQIKFVFDQTGGNNHSSNEEKSKFEKRTESVLLIHKFMAQIFKLQAHICIRKLLTICNSDDESGWLSHIYELFEATMYYYIYNPYSEDANLLLLCVLKCLINILNKMQPQMEPEENVNNLTTHSPPNQTDRAHNLENVKELFTKIGDFSSSLFLSREVYLASPNILDHLQTMAQLLRSVDPHFGTNI